METLRISSPELEAKLIPFGASLADLRLKQLDRPLVLGFRNPADFEQDKQFMGAIIGRYANRIAGGKATLGGRVVQLEQNENGSAHLHGGENGYATQFWSLEELSESAVTFAYQSPDGEGGFPGNLSVFAEYAIDGSTLRLTLNARSDKDTIINLCHHPYFNLDGRADILEHSVWIDAETYLPSNEYLIPCGEQTPVVNTPFDFKTMRHLPEQQFNNTYCLHRDQAGQLRHVASLQAGGVRLDLSTTQPGLHLYNGYKIKPTFESFDGSRYRANAGVCLEAQAWPDSPNILTAPTVELRAGATYRQTTEYSISQISG